MDLFRMVLLLAAILSAGCIPVPSRTTITPEIRGCITDALTGQPVSGAMVEHRLDEQYYQTGATGGDGAFSIGKIQQRHRAFVIGIALNYPYPYWRVLPMAPLDTTLYVSHPDYRLYTQTLHFRVGVDRKRVADQVSYDIQLVPQSGTADLQLGNRE